MNNSILFIYRLLIIVVCTLFCKSTFSQGEPFSTKQVLNQTPTNAGDRYYLMHPFAIVYGPDDSLWISERRGRVMKVNTTDGRRRIILDIRNFVKFTSSGGSIKQNGMMGLALHPNYPLVDSFFVAYAYNFGAGTRCRIVRYKVQNFTINNPAGNETLIIQGLPAGDDHSSGRLITGPDNKLYYAVGDLGANQFANRCNRIRSQDVPTPAELTAQNYMAYQGKILRINLDGSIPADNPTIKGIKSHIYSFGHRNPVGLTFAKDGSQQNYPGAKLYEAENGPATDDEVNEIIAGKNYGWPYWSGLPDDKIYQYKNWSSAANCNSLPSPGSEPECSTAPPAATVMNETDTVLPNAQVPIRTFFTPASASIPCTWLQNPTVAPSAIAFYGFDSKIPGWQNSLIMTTLKEGTVFRLKLAPGGSSFLPLGNGSDTARYFREENRYRDIAIGSDGLSFYLLTDSTGRTSGPTSGNTNILLNRGSILVYKYTGSTLSLGDPPTANSNIKKLLRLYPNPATTYINAEVKSNTAKPVYYFIYDVAGRIILNGKSFRDITQIDVSNLKGGTYFIKLFDGHLLNIGIQKFIVH